MSLLLIFYLIISSTTALGRLRIRFEDSDINLDNEEFITDDSPRTCATFNNGDDTNTLRDTTLRIEVADYIIDYVNVTLIGNNLGCGHSLYAIPLSAAETEKWTGLWITCPITEDRKYEDKERCSYGCRCRGSCEEIQVLKRPKTIKDSSWNLCYICITADYLDQYGGCEVDPTKTSGVYSTNPTSNTSDCIYKRDVYCDMEKDDGGWTVIMRREDGSVDFNREWEDYKLGFGSLNGEFWAGNQLIHQLTNDGRTYTLRVDLTDYDGDSIYAKYRNFSVGPESDNYTLHVSDYDDKSTASNNFQIYHDGCMFSTGSIDNDLSPSQHLAKKGKAPWWYCHTRNVVLTGQYGEYKNIISVVGIKWYYPWSYSHNAKFAVIMIRPN
ncbi:hypothetical protein LSH36_1g05011 [Paralvinella palmiformis]|uniref:Fibrinogen C-terminal domain-containing protein n=1 Tax=Paralvinella palmiformis TaxID=53620 RepID=A0AAD9KGE9_9ANNE|nr:hypothetical protein LSH36_1g05011 [Paralvinella palmiformis]